MQLTEDWLQSVLPLAPHLQGRKGLSMTGKGQAAVLALFRVAVEVCYVERLKIQYDGFGQSR